MKPFVGAGLLVSLVGFVTGCGGAAEPPASSETAVARIQTAAPARAVPVTAGWTVADGISTPESAYFDPDSGFIFTSQIVGQPDARDGNGRIAKLNGDGTVIAADWVTGLNAPKGLRSHQGTLWVADLGDVVSIDIATGTITAHVALDGAMLPNDVACGPDGTVYVTDTVGTRIYAVKDGKVSVFAEGETLEYPNGLLVESDRLIVGAWGKPEADFSTKVPGRLFALDLKTKQKTLITEKPFANIDGLESDGRGGYIVSDFTAGKILHVTATGASQLVRQFSAGTADLGFVPASGIIIVPHMNDNTVSTYDVSSALK